MNVIIFSKDRACQLDLLLRSIEMNVSGKDEMDFSILYTASNSDYQESYGVLEKLYPGFHFHFEKNSAQSFKGQLADLLNDDVPLTMFLVDDDVVKKPLSMNDNQFEQVISSEDILCLSLRMGKNINYCYSRRLHTPVPELDEKLAWNWRGQRGDWGYPMSLDGHVFRSKEINPLIRDVSFSNPNSLEACLAGKPLTGVKMCCYEESRLFNLPLNRVQTVFQNRSEEVDPGMLNEIFLKDKFRISLDPLDGVYNRSAHEPRPLEFEAWDV